MQNRIKIGTILITNYWLALGFSTVPQCRFAGQLAHAQPKDRFETKTKNEILIFAHSEVIFLTFGISFIFTSIGYASENISQYQMLPGAQVNLLGGKGSLFSINKQKFHSSLFCLRSLCFCATTHCKKNLATQITNQIQSIKPPTVSGYCKGKEKSIVAKILAKNQYTAYKYISINIYPSKIAAKKDGDIRQCVDLCADTHQSHHHIINHQRQHSSGRDSTRPCHSRQFGRSLQG